MLNIKLNENHLECFNSHHIIDVKTSEFHSVAINKKKIGWGMGSNLNGELFFFKKQFIHQYKQLEFKSLIEDFFVHRNYTILITKNKKLYISDNQLNSILIDEDVLSVDGNDTFISYTKYNKSTNQISLILWFLEWHPFLEYKKNSIHKHIILFQTESLEQIVDLKHSAGDGCLFFVFNNKMWVWGDNKDNRLINRAQFFLFEPIEVDLVKNPKNIFIPKKTSKEDFYILILTKEGDLWYKGKKNWISVSSNLLSKKDSANFNLIETGVIKVSVNGSLVLFLKENLTMYGWGDNKFKQISKTQEEYLETPFEMASLVQKIIAGDRHTIYQTSDEKFILNGLNCVGSLTDKEKGKILHNYTLFNDYTHTWQQKTDNGWKNLNINTGSKLYFEFLKENEIYRCKITKENEKTEEYSEEFLYSSAAINQKKLTASFIKKLPPVIKIIDQNPVIVDVKISTLSFLEIYTFKWFVNNNEYYSGVSNFFILDRDFLIKNFKNEERFSLKVEVFKQGTKILENDCEVFFKRKMLDSIKNQNKILLPFILQ